MNNGTIRAIAVVAATLLSIVVVNVIYMIFGMTDQSLAITLVAMLSSIFALDISRRLERKYTGNPPQTRNTEI